MELNTILDITYVTAVCTVIRFLVGSEGIQFGWTVIKTLAGWARGWK